MEVEAELVGGKEQALQEMLAQVDFKEIKEDQQALLAQQALLECQAQ